MKNIYHEWLSVRIIYVTFDPLLLRCFLHRMCHDIFSGRIMSLKRCEIWRLYAISRDYHIVVSERDKDNHEETRRGYQICSVGVSKSDF